MPVDPRQAAPSAAGLYGIARAQWGNITFDIGLLLYHEAMPGQIAANDWARLQSLLVHSPRRRGGGRGASRCALLLAPTKSPSVSVDGCCYFTFFC